MDKARSSHPPMSCLAVSAGWALLANLGASGVARGQDGGIDTSNDLAKAIIERAKSSETLDLNWLGDKTCFVAESLYAPSYAREWFPGYGIRDDQYRDKSEGVWNIIVSNDRERIVRIYSIDQSTLRWNVPEETKIVDAVGCEPAVRVIVSGASAEIVVVF